MRSRADTLRGLAAWSVIALQLILALAIARFGPTHPLPMHFNVSGEVDRWGDRNEAALIALAMAGVSALTLGGIGLLATREASDMQRGLANARWIAVLVTSSVCLLDASLVWGHAANLGPIFPMVVISAVLAAIGADLGKVAPNPIIGVRTPWAFASRLAWDKSNRLAGRLFFWGGVVGLMAAPVAPQPLGIEATIGFMLISAAASVFESWRVWRSDPERKAAF